MGCDNEPKTLDINDLIKQKSSFSDQISENKAKIDNYEKELQNIQNQIKQGENDIKLKQYQYSKEELQSKAKKLISLKRDEIRTQKSISYLMTMNETLKNNLESLERKINEYYSLKELEKGNELMKQINKENHNEILENNVNNLLVQQARDNQNQRVLERGNNLYFGNEGFNEQDYMKQLLGTPN